MDLSPADFLTNYNFRCHHCLWSGLSLYHILFKYLGTTHQASTPYLFLSLGSGLPSALPVKVSPNLSSSTP